MLHKISFTKFDKIRVLLIICISLFIVSGFACFSYFTAAGNFSGSTKIIALGFSPKVNNSILNNQSIDLSSTITNGKNLSPGAKGVFKIDLDFSDIDTDSFYEITFDRTNIPLNIHFYADEDLTSEITSLEGIHLKNYNDKSAEHFIYWEWKYIDNDNNNSDDSYFMDREISVPFTVRFSQHLDSRTIVVNDLERPTGRISLDGLEGSFTLNLDFTNLSNTNYRIHFNPSEVSNTLHLYSDSLFTNEITSIEDIYNANTSPSQVSKTIYWKFSDSTVTSGNLYYIFYKY